MKTSKNFYKHNYIESKSNLLLQLGLIIAMVLVYTLLEIQFVKTSSNLPKNSSLVEEPETYAFENFKLVKKKVAEEVKKEIKPKLLNTFIIENPDDKSILADSLLTSVPTQINFDSIFSDVPPIEATSEESTTFDRVEQAPRFPGCNGKTEEEFKNCFNKKMKSFVRKKFHPNTNIGLTGKVKIFVLFEIDKNGYITNINIKSSHKSLEKEALKTVKKLPKMIPGKQGDKNIGVKYVLPISVLME